MLSNLLSNSSLKRLQNQNVDVDSENLCKEFDIFLVRIRENHQKCLITKALASLNMNFDSITVLDLGYINVESIEQLNKVRKYIKKHRRRLIILDPECLDDYNLEGILISPRPKLTKFSKNNIQCLAYQRHYLAQGVVLDSTFHKSLGDINKNIVAVEPILRSCSTMQFELNAIKSTEFSEFGENFNPVGLTILQACQIARYSGFSKKLTEIAVTNYSLDSIAQCHTIALWIWYYLEGRNLDRKTEVHHSKDVTSYIVNSSILDTEIQFIKENTSERWWLINPENQESKIPCMYEDYLAVINEDSEDKILELLKSRDNTL